jgi:uncharacterized protein YggE
MQAWPLLLLGLLAAPAAAQDGARAGLPHITVPGSAMEEVEPDRAVLRLGVVSERKAAGEAAAETGRLARAAIDEIRAAGIEAGDIRTATATLAPVYDDDPAGRPPRRILRGYTARNTVVVRIRDLAKVAPLTGRLIDRGANLVEGVTFEVSTREQRLQALRVRAIQDADRQARAYADALGLRLGRVLEIDPMGADRPRPLEARMAAAAPAAGAMPLEPAARR